MSVETKDPVGSSRGSPGTMAASAAPSSASGSSSSSSSSSSVAGLHGGNYYDLTRNDEMCVEPRDVERAGSGHGRHRRHGAVMDDLRAYGAAKSSSSSVATKANVRPLPHDRRRCNNPFVIDLVSDGSDAEDDGVRKKRSLRGNNGNCLSKIGGPSSSSLPSSSPPLRQKRMRDGAPLRTTHPHAAATGCCHSNLPPRKTRDGAVITFGLLSLIDVLKPRDGNTLTCEGSASSSRSKLFAPIRSLPPSAATTSSNSNNASLFNRQPFHYLQEDNWSCGFRNLQMLISAMLPTLSSVFPEGVPCIAQIQSTMEALWREGFDRTNAEHHMHSLFGKETWIGTVEVWSYLSFNRIDSIIVQFIKTDENRAMLGSFVWAYFTRICGCGTSECPCNNRDSCRNPGASPVLHSFEHASNLLRGISEARGATASGREDRMRRRRCMCALPPLYLQWEGHSVTVVGVRKVSDDVGGRRPSFNLITFCPQKQQLPALKGKLLSELTRRESGVLGDVASSLDSRRSSELSEKFVRSVVELPTSKLRNKDCQILLTTAHVIDKAESRRRKSCTKNVGFLDAVASGKL